MPAAALAQDAAEVKQMGTTVLKDQAMELVNAKRYLEARPYMVELVTRISDSDDANLKKQLEDLYFFMAYSYVQEYDATRDDKLLDKAIGFFDKVIKEFPGGKIEAGEGREDALRREILEELETEIHIESFLCTVEHDYPAFHKLVFNAFDPNGIDSLSDLSRSILAI